MIPLDIHAIPLDVYVIPLGTEWIPSIATPRDSISESIPLARRVMLPESKPIPLEVRTALFEDE